MKTLLRKRLIVVLATNLLLVSSLVTGGKAQGGKPTSEVPVTSVIFDYDTSATLLLMRSDNYNGVGQATYTLVQVAPGADVEQVRKSLQARLPDTEVLTHDEFRKRSLDYWLFETGAGSGLIAGAVLAIVVGIVVVAQTLYASTKEHINEFATLRALGASAGFIRKVILWQAVLSALMGYVLGMVLAKIVTYLLSDMLPILMTFNLVWGLLVLTVGMCVLAAVSAILKVVRIDPAVVFSR